MAKRIVLAPGECLFRQGDTAEHAYIIESGMIAITADRRGKSRAINTVGAGEMLGELALLDMGPRTATATAEVETELSVLTQAQLSERLNHADPVLALLVRQAMQHLRREIQDGSVLEAARRHPTIERMRMEAELADAVERQELEVWYQPIVDLDARAYAGFEALVRWRHPTRGLVSPVDFIPLAEESAIIVDIGAWVLQEATRALRHLDTIVPTPLFMSVNVSGRQLEHPGLLQQMRDALGEPALAPGRIRLEVTEGLLISSQTARDTLRACKQYGMALMLDDFGTGYSSLAYLNQLPFDGLKIDRSFAGKMTEEGDGKKLVRAIFGLAKDLQRSVVMEGVETPAQRDALRQLGGRLCQGYLFGRPVPLADAIDAIGRADQLPWG